MKIMKYIFRLKQATKIRIIDLYVQLHAIIYSFLKEKNQDCVCALIKSIFGVKTFSSNVCN